MNLCELKDSFQVGTMLSFEGECYEKIASSIKATLLHNQEQVSGLFGAEAPNYMPITEIEIDGERKSLKRPILLEIVREGGVYIVENQALNVVASGDTVAEAIIDAKDTIENDFHFYSSTPENQLVGLGATLKKVYAKLF